MLGGLCLTMSFQNLSGIFPLIKFLSGENLTSVLIFLLSTFSKATNVLLLLGKLAAFALTRTGFFYCQVTPALRSERYLIYLSFVYFCSFSDSMTLLAVLMVQACVNFKN